MYKFEWDEDKNKSNLKKHGISFEEAKTVFYDENATEFFDEKNSKKEDRFIMLGFSNHLRLLVVCHCFRKRNSSIRIISARKATKNESEYYGGI
jgi:uncharacterized DUF497 family protein